MTVPRSPWPQGCGLRTSPQGMLTMTGEEATFTVAGSVVVPGRHGHGLDDGSASRDTQDCGCRGEGGIFWVAAALLMQPCHSSVGCCQ